MGKFIKKGNTKATACCLVCAVIALGLSGCKDDFEMSSVTTTVETFTTAESNVATTAETTSSPLQSEVLLSSTTNERGVKTEIELVDDSLFVYLYLNKAETEEQITNNLVEISINLSNTKEMFQNSDFLNISYAYKEDDELVGALFLNRTSVENNFTSIIGLVWTDDRYQEVYDNLGNETSTQETTAQETKVTDEEQLAQIYFDEYVTVSYSHISESDWMGEKSVVFVVENKTDYVLTFQSNSMSLDGVDLGYISMSDSVSPQSKGEIYATSEKITTTTPFKISGQIKVVEWDKELFGELSYEFKFVNVEI